MIIGTFLLAIRSINKISHQYLVIIHQLIWISFLSLAISITCTVVWVSTSSWECLNILMGIWKGSLALADIQSNQITYIPFIWVCQFCQQSMWMEIISEGYCCHIHVIMDDVFHINSFCNSSLSLGFASFMDSSIYLIPSIPLNVVSSYHRSFL